MDSESGCGCLVLIIIVVLVASWGWSKTQQFFGEQQPAAVPVGDGDVQAEPEQPPVWTWGGLFSRPSLWIASGISLMLTFLVGPLIGNHFVMRFRGGGTSTDPEKAEIERALFNATAGPAMGLGVTAGWCTFSWWLLTKDVEIGLFWKIVWILYTVATYMGGVFLARMNARYLVELELIDSVIGAGVIGTWLASPINTPIMSILYFVADAYEFTSGGLIAVLSRMGRLFAGNTRGKKPEGREYFDIDE